MLDNLTKDTMVSGLPDSTKRQEAKRMRRIVIFLFSLGNEVENPAREFGSALSESDINSCQKRFRTAKATPVYMRNYILLAVFAGLAVLATAAAGQQTKRESQPGAMTGKEP